MECQRQDSNSHCASYIIRLTMAGIVQPNGHVLLGRLVVYNVSAGHRELKGNCLVVLDGGRPGPALNLVVHG